MKKIIVLIDFSEQSENALKVAVSLAKKHDTEILALHMLELNSALISSEAGMYPEQTVFFLKLAEKRFKGFLNKDYVADSTITPIIKHFKVFSEVNEVAKKHNADMIIMGSHGTDGLKEIFIGSNAEKVVRNAEIPVLVIKKEHISFKIDRFVFASDFKEDKLPAFKKAKDFAAMLRAKLDLVYINVPGDNFLSTADAYEQINVFLQKGNIGAEVAIYNDYSVEEGILNYSESSGADIIGIPTHGRKGLSHFFMGSIGEDIVNHAEMPVVTFRI